MFVRCRPVQLGRRRSISLLVASLLALAVIGSPVTSAQTTRRSLLCCPDRGGGRRRRWAPTSPRHRTRRAARGLRLTRPRSRSLTRAGTAAAWMTLMTLWTGGTPLTIAGHDGVLRERLRPPVCPARSGRAGAPAGDDRPRPTSRPRWNSSASSSCLVPAHCQRHRHRRPRHPCRMPIPASRRCSPRPSGASRSPCRPGGVGRSSPATTRGPRSSWRLSPRTARPWTTCPSRRATTRTSAPAIFAIRIAGGRRHRLAALLIAALDGPGVTSRRPPRSPARTSRLWTGPFDPVRLPAQRCRLGGHRHRAGTIGDLHRASLNRRATGPSEPRTRPCGCPRRPGRCRVGSCPLRYAQTVKLLGTPS